MEANEKPTGMPGKDLSYNQRHAALTLNIYPRLCLRTGTTGPLPLPLRAKIESLSGNIERCYERI